jgi:hypothetical protein
MKWAESSLLGIDAKFEAMTKRLSPDPVVGALLGFCVGYMAANSFSFLGFDTPRFLSLAIGLFAAIGGCVVGVLRQGPPGRGRAVGWWCATMLISVGSASLVIGFIGCMLFVPGNLSPLFAYFVIGPLGLSSAPSAGWSSGSSSETLESAQQVDRRNSS